MSELEKLCDEYEQKRETVAAAGDETVAAIPPILTVILTVIPVLLPMILSGKFDPAVLVNILPTILTAIGVPAELIALAQQIITLILNIRR